MENTHITNLITEQMEKYSITPPFNELKINVQEQLVKIEQYFQIYLKEQVELAERLKHQKINLSTVCENANIPRSSVYNSRDVLKKYITERIMEIEHNNFLSNDKKKDEEYRLLKMYLENAKVHMVENDILELKITELEQDIAELEKIKIVYELELSKIKNENAKLKVELSKTKRKNLISFNQ